MKLLLIALLLSSCVETTSSPVLERYRRRHALDSGDLAALDAKYGFRDLEFEVPLASLDGMGCTKLNSGEDVCRRTTDSLRIGGSRLDEITYTFHDGKLFSVLLTAKGWSNGRALLMALASTYGPGRQDNRYIENYRWHGDKVILIYTYDSASEGSRASFASLAVFEAIRAKENAAAADGKDDL